MDILLYIGSILLIVLGLIGCVLPVVPGPILALVGYLLLLLTPAGADITYYSIAMAVFATLLTIISDFIIPVIGVKIFNGTSYGKWGSFIGGIVGVFFMPLGIILGPFLGALIGELLGGADLSISLNSAVGAFIGFLCGTVFKILVVLFILALALKDLI